MKARHKDTGEIIQLAEEGIESSDGRRFCWYQVELIPEPIDEVPPEVDLEKEIDNFFNGWNEESEYGGAVKPDCYSPSLDDCKKFARHFYELGLNARK